MRYSLYNTFIPISEEKTLLYNAFSDKFVILTAGANDSIVNTTPDRLDSQLYEKLPEAGTIVDNQTDEIRLVKQRIDTTDNDNSFFDLHMNRRSATNALGLN